MSVFPKVIGYVPAYNAENFILSTLQALAAQTYPNFEILICDDASSDQTWALCQEFCESDSRFKVIRNSRNLGWFETSNQLWLQVSKDSSYCFCNPHDDHPGPEYITELVGLMEATPDSSIGIPGMKNVYSDGIVIDSFYTYASEIKDPVERCFRIAQKDKHHWWAAYHGLYRSKFVQKVYPIRKLAFGEKEFSLDLVSMLKMGFYGPFVTSDQILLTKIYRKSSVSSQWHHNSLNKTALWLLILEEIKKSPLSLKQKSELSKKLNSLLISRLVNRISSLFKKVG